MNNLSKTNETLEAVFADTTKEVLVDIAKMNNFRGYSSLKKKELAAWLSEKLLDNAQIEEVLEHSDEEEMGIFEAAMKSESGILLGQEMIMSSRLLYCYGGYDKEYRLSIPADVQEKYRAVCTEEFKKNHREKWTFYRYCGSALYLYGVLTTEKLAELYYRYEKKKITPAQIEPLCEEMIRCGSQIALKDGFLMDAGLKEDNLYQRLLEVQGDQPFYMPETKEKFLWYGIENCQEPNEHTEKFFEFLKEKIHMNELQAVLFFREIQNFIRSNAETDKMLEVLTEEGYEIPTDELREELVREIKAIRSRIRSWDHRGFTLAERREQEREKQMQQMQAMQNMMKRASFPSIRKNTAGVMKGTKIYPNDPCTCGSGKKYKHCCGRK